MPILELFEGFKWEKSCKALSTGTSDFLISNIFLLSGTIGISEITWCSLSTFQPYFLKLAHIYPQNAITENSNLMLPLGTTCKPTAHTTPLFPNYHFFFFFNLFLVLGFLFVLFCVSVHWKTQRAGLLLRNLHVIVAILSVRLSRSVAIRSSFFHFVLRSCCILSVLPQEMKSNYYSPME